MILVTGHKGFVGQHLMRALEGQQVWGIDLKTGDDILDTPVYPNVERVYHLAAQTDAQSTDAYYDAQNNVMGTLRLLDKYGDRVVLASTSMVNYPFSPYAISKRACEDYARYYGAAIVRFCNLYGDGGHSAFDRFAKDDEITIRGSGEQRRTYTHVANAVDALLTVKPGETRVLHGSDYRLNDLVQLYPNKPVSYAPASPLDIIEGAQI